MTNHPTSAIKETEFIIRGAGNFIRKEWENFSRHRVESKGKNDLVSYVDRETENQLVKAFSELIPGSGFILEEAVNIEAAGDFRWIIDPLDGTTNFIHGVPAFAISVALQQNEKTIAGWVLEVPADNLFFAEAGCGATKNGFPIRVSPEPEFAKSLIATGFPYSKNALPADYLSVLAEFVKHTHGVRRFGAAALDLVWVAEGRFEGFYEIGLQPWDVAAGILIIQEAGGQISAFSKTGDPLFGRQILASNGLIHREMLEILKSWSHLFPG